MISGSSLSRTTAVEVRMAVGRGSLENHETEERWDNNDKTEARIAISLYSR